MPFGNKPDAVAAMAYCLRELLKALNHIHSKERIHRYFIIVIIIIVLGANFFFEKNINSIQ